MDPLLPIFDADDVLSLASHAPLHHHRDDNGRSPLHRAVAHGATDCALWLLDHSTEAMDSADFQGETPLMRAAWLGNAVLVEELLERGANPYPASLAGGTALHHAHAAPGNVDKMVALLVAKGANPLALDTEGRKPEQWQALGQSLRVGQEFMKEQRQPRVLTLKR